VLLLSDALWRRRFNADPSVVNRTIVMNDREYRVIGVMPASFEALDTERYYGTTAELWAPIGYDLKGDSSCRSCQHLRGFGRLKLGVSVADANAEMNTIREQMRREFPSDYDTGSIAVVPLRDALTWNVRPALLVLLGAVGFVLLIACANVANLLLARSVSRQRELTLRAALGAGRARIARQLLTESLLLSAIGGIAGVLLAVVAVQGLAAFAPVALPRIDRMGVDARVLFFTAAMTIVTGFIFGLVPAVRGGAGAQQALAIDSRSSVGGRSRARAALVIADLALALVLLAGAGLMLRTVAALMRTSPGFDPSRVLALDFSLVGQAYAEDPAVVAFQERAVGKLRALPGVEAVSIAGQIPFGGNGDCRGFHVNGRMKPNTSEDPCIERYGVTPGYLEMMKIPLLAGRSLTAGDTTGAQPVLVISKSTARLVFGDDSPLGAQVRVGSASRGQWWTIVGVVADVHHEDVTAAPSSAMYIPQAQFTDSYLVALVKTSAADPLTVASAARKVFRDLDNKVPVYRIATVPSLVADASAQRTFVTRLLGGFALIAVLLAAIGLYGVVSYGVALRTREVGLRIALGAGRGDILRLVLTGGAGLVVAGVVAGLAGAVVGTRVLGSLVFGVSPLDPVSFGGATLVLIAIALLAHWVPVRRALRIDPAIALRAE
jgi:putative ABC transport system permease protein